VFLTFYLHKFALPIIFENQNKILIKTISLKQVNVLALVGCISFISWPLAMFLGTFKKHQLYIFMY